MNLFVLLFAALSFVAFSTAHVSRAVATPGLVSSAVFAPGDICGDPGEGTSRDCPSCILAASLLLAEDLSVAAPLVWHKSVWIGPSGRDGHGRVAASYHARAPPVFS